MRRKDLQDIKTKRILLYYRELARHKITHIESVEFISYIFAVSDRWIEEILRKNDMKFLNEAVLQHRDIDLKIIDAFVKKLYKQARGNRFN